MPEHDVHGARVSARRAFHALPPERPTQDTWRRVAQKLRDRRHARRRRNWILAVAAVLAVALWLPRSLTPPPSDPSLATLQTSPAEALARLKQSSAHLESLLREVRDEGEDAGAAMLQARLQDEIAGIDALLASSPTSPEIEHWLWSERVLRLQRLAGLNTASHMLAAQDRPASTSPPIY